MTKIILRKHLLIGIVLVTPLLAQTGTKNGQWRSYGGDTANTKYAPLDQINAANFNKLELAWHFKTENIGPRPEFNLEVTPLMANGVIYATAGTRRAACSAARTARRSTWARTGRSGAMSRSLER